MSEVYINTWRKLRSLIPLAILPVMVCLTSLEAQGETLNIWMIPNEPPLNNIPPAEEQNLFFTDLSQYLQNIYPNDKDFRSGISSLIKVSDISAKVKNDTIFAKWVFGQKQIFKELDNYIQTSNFSKEIWVKFFKWEEYLNSLKIIPSSPYPPDIIQTPSSWVAYLADKEIIVHLPNNVADSMEEHYIDAALKTCKIDGKLFGLPWLIDLRLLFFYRDIFPNPEINLKDRESFEKALRQAPRQSYLSPFALPTAVDWDLLHQTALFIWGSQGELVRVYNLGIASFKKALFDNDKGMETIRFLSELTRANCLDLPRKNRYALEEDFLDGKYGSMICGPWLAQKLFNQIGREWDRKIGVALPPVYTGNQKGTFLGGSNLSISRMALDGGNFEATLELIRFLSGGPSSFRYTLATGHLPGAKEGLGTVGEALENRENSENMFPENYLEYLASITANEATIEVFEEALKVGRSYPSIPEWPTEIEVPTTRVGLYHLWQVIAAHESVEVIEADLEEVVREINIGLFWKPLMFYGLGILITGFIILLAIYILRIIRMQKIIGDKERQIESFKSEIIKLYLKRIDLESNLQEKEIEIKDLKTKGKISEEELGKLSEGREEYKAQLLSTEKDLKEMSMKLHKIEKEHSELINSLANQNEFAKKLTQILTILTGQEITEEKVEPILNHREIREDAAKAWIDYNQLLKQKLKVESFEGMVCRPGNERMEYIFTNVIKFASPPSSVLIRGETGTGKELIAKAIHNNGPRKEKPFVAQNCAALPDTLVENELFGSEKGAFTGANQRRIGKFEQATGGSIFLDEIGEMPMLQQAKLLRVLQEKKFTPLGSEETIKVDVRVISASNVDLEKSAQEGKFREDLYFRLNVLSIILPPLRERRLDIPYITHYRLNEYAKDKNVSPKHLAENSLKALICYKWPGNIRELDNFVERVYAKVEKKKVKISHLQNDDLFDKIKQSFEQVFIPPQEYINEWIKIILQELKPEYEILANKIAKGIDAPIKIVHNFKEKVGLNEDTNLSSWIDKQAENLIKKEGFSTDEEILKEIRNNVACTLYLRLKDHAKNSGRKMWTKITREEGVPEKLFGIGGKRLDDLCKQLGNNVGIFLDQYRSIKLATNPQRNRG